jgi:Putative metallopeptidase
MRTRPRLTPRFLHLLCLGWLLVICVSSALGGVFQVMEEPPHDPTVAMVRQHVYGPLRVWTTVLTELFRLPTDVTVMLASCGRIDAFYSPAQQRIYLCDELLTYFAQVFAPPEDSAAAVHDATLFTFFHVVGHALIQVLDLPVTGPGEEAADEVGAVFLVVGEAEDEQAVLAGSRVLFQRSRVLDPAQTVPFWALHPWTTQRYVRLRCLLYGSNPTRHAALLEDGGLSAALAQQCPETWQRQEQHWHTLLASHLRPPEPTPDGPPPVGALEEVSAPEQALRAYYDAINRRQYAHTWLLLAPQFKQIRFCCEADGSYQFSRYRAWWDLVVTVEILDTHVHERQPDAAVVQATVRYTMHSGRVTEETHRFRLVVEPETQRWLIAEQTLGVLRPRGP